MNTISIQTVQHTNPMEEPAARREANLAAFRKMMEEAVQKANEQAHKEYLSQLTNPTSTNVRLTDEQRKYLSERYDTENMRSEEHTSELQSPA